MKKALLMTEPFFAPRARLELASRFVGITAGFLYQNVMFNQFLNQYFTFPAFNLFLKSNCFRAVATFFLEQ